MATVELSKTALLRALDELIEDEFNTEMYRRFILKHNRTFGKFLTYDLGDEVIREVARMQKLAAREEDH